MEKKYNNIEKYNNAFQEVFEVDLADVSKCSKEMSNWTSLNLMRLIVCLEKEFDIVFDLSAAEDFESYEAGKKVLKEYGISID